MRINPVSAAGRPNLRRRRPTPGETGEDRSAGFASYLPAPLDAPKDRGPRAYSSRYLPNSAFLAHLIATRDAEQQTWTPGRKRNSSEIGADAYRATAALPRRRAAGHLVKTER